MKIDWRSANICIIFGFVIILVLTTISHVVNEVATTTVEEECKGACESRGDFLISATYESPPTCYCEQGWILLCCGGAPYYEYETLPRKEEVIWED